VELCHDMKRTRQGLAEFSPGFTECVVRAREEAGILVRIDLASWLHEGVVPGLRTSGTRPCLSQMTAAAILICEHMAEYDDRRRDDSKCTIPETGAPPCRHANEPPSISTIGHGGWQRPPS